MVRRYIPSPNMSDPKDPKGPRTPLADILKPQRVPTKLDSDPATKASAPEGGWRSDVLEDARRAIVEIMRAKNPPRGTGARLNAAKLILTENFLSQISDESLLAEVSRRAGMNAREETSNEVEEKEDE